MNVLASKKYLFLGLALSMLIVILQYRPMPRIPVASYSPSPVAAPAPSPLRAAVHRVHKKIMTLTAPPAPKVVATPAEALRLEPNVRQYNYLFSGQTLCGPQSCPATLEIFVESPRNPDLHRTIETMADGTFWFQVPVTETSQEQVDWKITAHTRDGQDGG